MNPLSDQSEPVRWWRVVPRNGKSVWLQQEPTTDMLSAAWEGATVEGPFVPERAFDEEHER